VAESTACASNEVLSAISSLRAELAARRGFYAPTKGVDRVAMSQCGAPWTLRTSAERQFQADAAILALRLIVGHQKHAFGRDLCPGQHGLLQFHRPLLP